MSRDMQSLRANMTTIAKDGYCPRCNSPLLAGPDDEVLHALKEDSERCKWTFDTESIRKSIARMLLIEPDQENNNG